MALISHEIPKQLFPYHDLINDYPYVLAHLLEKDKEYTEFYKQKLLISWFSILDNSAFELGSSIDMKLLIDLARKYYPTHVVIPDVVNDFKQTVDKFAEFKSYYNENKDVLNKFSYIGVVQGDTFDDIASCINIYLKSGIVSLIAFPFDLVPNSEFVTVRYRFFTWLYERNPELFSKLRYKVHLLGCNNPVEYLLFREDRHLSELLFSVDTSSPIINGWTGNKFGEHGLFGDKPKDKLADNLDIKLNNNQIELIVNNVLKFREYVNGSSK